MSCLISRAGATGWNGSTLPDRHNLRLAYSGPKPASRHCLTSAGLFLADDAGGTGTLLGRCEALNSRG
jgi:hypothetical protein